MFLYGEITCKMCLKNIKYLWKFSRLCYFFKILEPNHMAVIAKPLWVKASFELDEHPPYLPDLAPGSYRLFSKLKGYLHGTRFSSDNDLISPANQWIAEVEQFFVQEVRHSILTCLIYVKKIFSWFFQFFSVVSHTTFWKYTNRLKKLLLSL